MNYQYQKSCECGNIDSMKVSKIEAAFELNYHSFIKKKCSKCGEKKITFASVNGPSIDKELLKIWSENTDYRFSPQDEELSLAQYKENIELYLEFIDSQTIDITKKNILIEALCVMIYDRTNKIDKENIEIVNKISTELKKRENQVFSAEHYIRYYLKQVSFPIIGIEYKENLNSKSDKEFHKNYLELTIKESIDKQNSKNGLWNKIKRIWK